MPSLKNNPVTTQLTNQLPNTPPNHARQKTTLAQLRLAVAQFVGARQWEPYHNPKNLAMSISIEAAELQEHFQWGTIEDGMEYVQDEDNRLAVADELADVLIYCLSFANATGIDVSTAILDKLARNEHRFPVE